MGNQYKDAFISYGRAESIAFAGKLYKSLREVGMDAWFDKVNIPHGDDYQQRIDNGIESAHNFIIILAPHAINSVYCRKEVELAAKLKKRIIPIVHIEPDSKELWEEVPEVVSRIDYIFCRENLGDLKLLKKWADKQEWETLQDASHLRDWMPFAEWEEADDFQRVFSKVVGLIRKDDGYVHQHTDLLIKALEWQSKNFDPRLLLVGKERIEAEKWLLTEFEPPAQPPCLPTDLHGEFISESRKNAHNLMTDVFISYATENKQIRQQVSMALARKAITTWTHTRDIRTGRDFHEAIEEGIEQADNFLFFISKESVVSDYCIKELEHAEQLHKRVIPLLIEEVPSENFPPQIGKLQYIDFTDNVEHEDFNDDIKDILAVLQSDKEYYRKHKAFLAKALKWEEQKRNPSILLRGYDLDEALSWLDLGRKRKNHPPTTLHEEFIKESNLQRGQLRTDVFVSYSRTDGDFARKINNELQLNGKTTWFDLESIASGSQFQEEINKGIENADNVVFILSPEAVSSKYCAEEVAYAEKLGKRFIPLLYRAIEPAAAPKTLSSVQWINFEHNRSDFNTAFGELVRTLDTDREHVQQHTHWSQKALEWQTKGKNNDLLLVGSELENSLAWLDLAKKYKKKPIVHQLQQEFIETSRKQAEIHEEKQKRARQFTLAGIGVLVLLLLAVGWVSYVSTQQGQTVTLQKLVFASQNYAARDPNLAVRLAYEAYHYDPKAAKPPHLVKNICNIINEVYEENLYINLPHRNVEKLSFSPDGQYILTQGIERDEYDNPLQKTVKVWGNEGELLQELNYEAGQGEEVEDAFFGLWGEGDEKIILKINHSENVLVAWDFWENSFSPFLDGVFSDGKFSPSRQYFLTLKPGDSKSELWESKSGKYIGSFENLLDIAYSSDESHALSYSDGADHLLLTDLASGSARKLSLLLENPSATSNTASDEEALRPDYIAFSKTDSLGGFYIMASASEQGTQLWDGNGKKIKTFPANSDIYDNDLYYNVSQVEMPYASGQNEGIFFSKDGSSIVGLHNGYVAKYGFEGNEIDRIALGEDVLPQAIHVSPNAQYLVAVWNEGQGATEDQKLYSFDSDADDSEGVEIELDNLMSSYGDISINFSPTSDYFLVGYTQEPKKTILASLQEAIDKKMDEDYTTTGVSKEGILAIFDSRGKKLETFSLIKKGTFSPDGKKIHGFTDYAALLWASEGEIERIVNEVLEMPPLTYSQRVEFGMVSFGEILKNIHLGFILNTLLYLFLLHRVGRQLRRFFLEKEYFSVGLFGFFYLFFGFVQLILLDIEDGLTSAIYLFYGLFFLYISYSKFKKHTAITKGDYAKFAMSLLFIGLVFFHINTLESLPLEEIISGFLVTVGAFLGVYLLIYVPLRLAMRHYYLRHLKAFYKNLILSFGLPLLTLAGGAITMMPVWLWVRHKMRRKSRVKRYIFAYLPTFVVTTVSYAWWFTIGVPFLYILIGILLAFLKPEIYPAYLREKMKTWRSVFQKKAVVKPERQAVPA